MILDHISQLDTYQGVSPDIYAGLRYLSSLSPNIALGEHRVNDRVLALVTEYPTKVENEGRYEAHRHVIDIQFPIKGREGIEWSVLAGMKSVTDYDAEKDRTMYTRPDNKTDIVIGNGYFAVFWPNDAHNPQRAVDGASETIKKVTLKVSLR
jgi:YhcH/YjgK/YiaL family protein